MPQNTEPELKLLNLQNLPWLPKIAGEGILKFAFSNKNIGEGILKKISLIPEIQITHLNITLQDDSILQFQAKNTQYIYLNYILNYAEETLLSIDRQHFNNNLDGHGFLLIDNSKVENKYIKIKKQHTFEVIQIGIEQNYYQNKILSALINNNDHQAQFESTITNSSYTKLHMGTLYSISFAEKLCLKNLIEDAGLVPMDRIILQKLKLQELSFYLQQKKYDFKNHVREHSNTEMALISNIENLLMNHLKLSYKLPIHELSSQYKITPYKINKLFVELLGYSISKYHKRKILDYAFHKILSKGMTSNITEIAYNLEFSSVASFSRAFYQQFRIRPSEVKNNRKK